MKKFTRDDEIFMQHALIEAKKAFLMNEVPIGAVLVIENKIISSAHNKTMQTKKMTGHAEIICMEAASQILNDWRLVNANLYVTVEPCYMCAGAAILGRVKRIIWGTEDSRFGACGSLSNIFEKRHPIHQVEVSGGLFAEESRELIQSFFRKKREENRARKLLSRAYE